MGSSCCYEVDGAGLHGQPWCFIYRQKSIWSHHSRPHLLPVHHSLLPAGLACSKNSEAGRVYQSVRGGVPIQVLSASFEGAVCFSCRMSEGDSVGDSVHGKPSVVYRFFTRLGQVSVFLGD